MERRLEELESQVAKLTEHVARLAERVQTLEQPGAVAIEQATAVSTPDAPTPAPIDATGKLSLIGRTLIEFAGGYVLRAFTDSHTVTPLVGVTLGLLYAAMLLGLADRSARRGRTLSASFHGFAATAMAFPLLGEASMRFHLFGPHGAASAIGAVGLAGLALAFHRRLLPLGWFTAFFSLAAAMALGRLGGVLLPFAVATLVLATAIELVSAKNGSFSSLRWPGAVASNLVLFYLAWAATRPAGTLAGFVPVAPHSVLWAELALVMLYVASIGGRAVLRGVAVSPFGLLQGPLAVLIGLSGAARVVAFQGGSPTWLGVGALGLGAAAYPIAFGHPAVRAQPRNVQFYVWIGGLLIFGGTAWLLSESVLGLAWSALALAAVAYSSRSSNLALRFQGAAFALAAAYASGLFAIAADGLIARATDAWHPIRVPALVAALAIALTCFLLATARAEGARLIERLPMLLVAAVGLCGLGGLLARSLAGVCASAPGPTADAGYLAALRSGILAVSAIALAAVGRHARATELRWLAPIVLAIGGLKLLVEDFPNGRPASELFSLALYGAALILAPRLMRRGSPT